MDLRTLTVDDATDLYATIDEGRAYLGRLAWTQNATIETVQNYIVATNASTDRLWGIFIDNKPIGCITLRDKQECDEIGYWLDWRYRDQGIMTQAVRWVLQQLPLRTVRAKIAHGNIASRNVLMRNNFEIYDKDDVWTYLTLDR